MTFEKFNEATEQINKLFEEAENEKEVDLVNDLQLVLNCCYYIKTVNDFKLKYPDYSYPDWFETN